MLFVCLFKRDRRGMESSRWEDGENLDGVEEEEKHD